MCMGCMAQADFLATGGLLGAASLRVGARMLVARRSPTGPVAPDETMVTTPAPPASTLTSGEAPTSERDALAEVVAAASGGHAPG